MTLRIREILKEKGLTNTDLQRMLGVSKQYTSNVINGYQNVSIMKLQEIADALGVHISDLFAKPECTEEDNHTQKEEASDFIAMCRFRGEFFHTDSIEELEKLLVRWKAVLSKK